MGKEITDEYSTKRTSQYSSTARLVSCALDPHPLPYSIVENNTLQFRPTIPRRSSISRLPASHHPLVTSQIHNHHEQKYSTRRFDSDGDHEGGIDSAIDSQSTNPTRSVHSSSTRRKAERLFSNGSDFESTSARTLTPERSNESGVYSQSTRDTEHNINGVNR